MDIIKTTENSREITRTLKQMESEVSRLKKLLAENKESLAKLENKANISNVDILKLEQQYAEFGEMLDDLDQTAYVTREMSNGVSLVESTVRVQNGL